MFASCRKSGSAPLAYLLFSEHRKDYRQDANDRSDQACYRRDDLTGPANFSIFYSCYFFADEPSSTRFPFLREVVPNDIFHHLRRA